MNTEKWEPNELPVDCLENVLGEISTVEQESPGVYYLSVSGSGKWEGGEYYALWTDAPDISGEAKEYGLSTAQCPGLLLYPFAKDDSGWRIVQYELYKYRTINKIPLPVEDTLTETALYSTEIHPEYFGTYPVPVMTPWGHTLRHRALDNGIYWIETSQCDHILAVCAPIWQELSSAATEIAIQVKYDPGIDGALFFDEAACCIPIWELMKLRHEWEQKIIDKAALMNTIWQRFPQYAAVYNAQVQQGLQDTMGLLFNAVGVEMDLNSNMDDMISISPHAGSEFLHL